MNVSVPLRGSALVLGSAVVLFLSAGAARANDLCNNTNGAGVMNGPRTTSSPCNLTGAAHITQLITYHWNGGRGERPGTLTLISRTTGARFGPFAAGGSSGQGGAPNVNWTANVNLNVPAGAYEVFDSSVPTWSWNVGSSDNGFLKVEGTYTGAATGGGSGFSSGGGGGFSSGGGGGFSSGSSSSLCPTGNVKGQPIGGLNCPCNYPVGWGSPTVNLTNPGLKNWYPSCKAPLQCVSPPGQGYGASSCH
jgi:hypothetical protein